MAEATNIGTARIDVEVDVTDLEAAVARAKSRLADMSSDAQRQYQQLNAAEKRRVDRLIEQADTLGMTKAQQLAYNAALRTSGPVLDEITRKLAQNEAKLKASAAQFNQYGMTAKMTAAAMRQVPMQLTDIFVGLATGQRPMMVLLQQGGQLKDLFGGIVPAAKALGSALMGLVNPYTMVAAAVGALGVQLRNSQEQAFAFERAIVMSGNAANATAAGLGDMAYRLDKVSGTQRAAAKVLTEMAGSGRVAGSVLERAAEAALRLKETAGIAVEETVSNLVALGERPYEAARRLDRQYRFLSAATLERVRMLEEEGRVSEAASLAQSSYADAMIERSEQLGGKVGWLRQLFQGARKAAAEFWDEVGGGVVSREEEIERLQRRLEKARVTPFFSMGMGPEDGALVGLEPALQARLNVLQREQISEQRFRAAIEASQQQFEAFAAAQQRWAKIEEANLSRREKMEREIAEVRKTGLAARKSEAEIERQIAAIRERYATSPRSNPDENSAKSLIETIERQIEANNQLALTGERVTASESLAARARQMLADSTNKMTDATRAYLTAVLPTLEASDKAAAAAERERKAKEALARQELILAQQQQNRRAANEVDLLAFGRGQEAVEQLQRRIDINRQYEAELRRIGDRSVAEDQELWEKLAENARATRDQMLREEEEYQRQRAAMMGDPVLGARAAWEDFVSETANAAGQTYDLISGTFDEAADAIAKFAATGKLSFTSLANSILSDLGRLGANKLLMTLLGAFMPSAVPAAGAPVKENAVGGVYNSPGLSAYSNQIVSQPTIFPFAKGVGLMGEAGPEAILPLKRTQGGKLGVMATGVGGDIQVQVNNYVGGKTGVRQERVRMPDGQELRKLIVDIVADDLGGGGKTAAAARSRFNLQEAM